MPIRLPNILSLTGRSRSGHRAHEAHRRRHSRGPQGERCKACGEAITRDDHAINLARGSFHAGCVLYQPRETPRPPGAAGADGQMPVAR